MTVFTCRDDFVSILTAVYDAWASRLGHANVRIELEPIMEPELFCDYVHVEADSQKADKVVSSIIKKINMQSYRWVYYAICSTDPQKADIVYRFLIRGFHFGPSVTQMLQDPVVMQMKELSRLVSHEAHLSLEFMRFVSVDGRFYVAHLSPKGDVLMTVAEHFADRMPSEHWMIIDDTRCYAVVHPVDSPFYIRELTPEEMAELSTTDESRDYFVSLWKTYFNAIAIEERKNYICQRTHFPLWMRSHTTEFLD